jgi:hypothetical protein
MKVLTPLAFVAAALAIGVVGQTVAVATAQVTEQKPGYTLTFTEQKYKPGAKRDLKKPYVGMVTGFSFPANTDKTKNRRISALLTFKPVAEETTIHFVLYSDKNNKEKGEFMDVSNRVVEKGKDYAMAEFVVNDAGTYSVVANEYEKDDNVYARGTFKVTLK